MTVCHDLLLFIVHAYSIELSRFALYLYPERVVDRFGLGCKNRCLSLKARSNNVTNLTSLDDEHKQVAFSYRSYGGMKQVNNLVYRVLLLIYLNFGGSAATVL